MIQLEKRIQSWCGKAGEGVTVSYKQVKIPLIMTERWGGGDMVQLEKRLQSWCGKAGEGVTVSYKQVKYL